MYFLNAESKRKCRKFTDHKLNFSLMLYVHQQHDDINRFLLFSKTCIHQKDQLPWKFSLQVKTN